MVSEMIDKNSVGYKIALFRLTLFYEKLKDKLTFLAMFLAIVLVLYGVTFEVKYKSYPVLSVREVTGRDPIHRLVVVQLEDRQRAIRTSDPYLTVRTGDMVCVAQRKVLLRRWARYYLEVPNFCRSTEIR